MLITLSPQVRSDTLSMSVSGDVLTLNGKDYDFSFIGEGDTLPRAAVDCEYLVGNVTRADGEIVLTLILPITVDADEASRFPVKVVTKGQGRNVILPGDGEGDQG